MVLDLFMYMRSLSYSPSYHAAREKVALLIGNQRYDQLQKLKETEDETMKLAMKLKEAKFKVCNHYCSIRDYVGMAPARP